jgi:hypothetical protein
MLPLQDHAHSFLSDGSGLISARMAGCVFRFALVSFLVIALQLVTSFRMKVTNLINRAGRMTERGPK